MRQSPASVAATNSNVPRPGLAGSGQLSAGQYTRDARDSLRTKQVPKRPIFPGIQERKFLTDWSTVFERQINAL